MRLFARHVGQCGVDGQEITVRNRASADEGQLLGPEGPAPCRGHPSVIVNFTHACLDEVRCSSQACGVVSGWRRLLGVLVTDVVPGRNRRGPTEFAGSRRSASGASLEQAQPSPAGGFSHGVRHWRSSTPSRLASIVVTPSRIQVSTSCKSRWPGVVVEDVVDRQQRDAALYCQRLQSEPSRVAGDRRRSAPWLAPSQTAPGAVWHQEPRENVRSRPSRRRIRHDDQQQVFRRGDQEIVAERDLALAFHGPAQIAQPSAAGSQPSPTGPCLAG